ncbi:hypothetical protein JXJ21_04210 [candidate division KSB1 bacterium]|nr:hypothetical protein [candidate division KSB1 bacterium]
MASRFVCYNMASNSLVKKNPGYSKAYKVPQFYASFEKRISALVKTIFIAAAAALGLAFGFYFITNDNMAFGTFFILGGGAAAIIVVITLVKTLDLRNKAHKFFAITDSAVVYGETNPISVADQKQINSLALEEKLTQLREVSSRFTKIQLDKIDKVELKTAKNQVDSKWDITMLTIHGEGETIEINANQILVFVSRKANQKIFETISNQFTLNTSNEMNALIA